MSKNLRNQVYLAVNSLSINNITINAPQGSSYTLTLPTNDGTNGQVLTTDGNGVLSWTSGGSLPGVVTSVAVSVPSFLSVSGSPITSSGTIAITGSSTGTGSVVLATSPTITTPTITGELVVNGQITQGYTSFSAISRLVIPLPLNSVSSATIRISFFNTPAANITLSGNTLANGSGTNNPVVENIETTLEPSGVNTVTSTGIIANSIFTTSWCTTKIDINTLTSGSAARLGYYVTANYVRTAVGTSVTTAQGYLPTNSLSLILTPSTGLISGRWCIQGY